MNTKQAEYKTDIAHLRADNKIDIAHLRADNKTDISDLKAEMAKRETRLLMAMVALISVAVAILKFT